MDICGRMKLIRESYGESQAKFSLRFGLAQNTYGQYEIGKRAIPDDFKLQLAEKYKVNLHWLITGEGSMFIDGKGEMEPSSRPHIYKEEDRDNVSVPMTSLKVSAGGGKTWGEGEYTGEILKIPRRVARRYPGNSDFAGALVTGDSMEPTLHDGEPVVFVNSCIQGDGIYVLAVDDTLLVKRLEFDRISGVLHIISDNPRYSPKEIPLSGLDNVRILGKVVIWVHGEI